MAAAPDTPRGSPDVGPPELSLIFKGLREKLENKQFTP
jgi:hypothetical protein